MLTFGFRCSSWKRILARMTTLLDRAMEAARTLPPEEQDEIARLVLQLARGEGPSIVLTSEERAAIAESRAAAAGGDSPQMKKCAPCGRNTIFENTLHSPCAYRPRGCARHHLVSLPQEAREAFNRAFALLSSSWRTILLVGARTDDPSIRRLLVTPYPYLVFYEVLGDEIIIHAVRHGSRDPSSMPGAD